MKNDSNFILIKEQDGFHIFYKNLKAKDKISFLRDLKQNYNVEISDEYLKKDVDTNDDKKGEYSIPYELLLNSKKVDKK